RVGQREVVRRGDTVVATPELCRHYLAGQAQVRRGVRRYTEQTAGKGVEIDHEDSGAIVRGRSISSRTEAFRSPRRRFHAQEAARSERRRIATEFGVQ